MKYQPLPNKPQFHGPPPWYVTQQRLLEIASGWEALGIYPSLYGTIDSEIDLVSTADVSYLADDVVVSKQPSLCKTACHRPNPPLSFQEVWCLSWEANLKKAFAWLTSWAKMLGKKS